MLIAEIKVNENIIVYHFSKTLYSVQKRQKLKGFFYQ